MSNGFVRYFKPTAPNSSGYVPYVGATQDVNLGDYGLDTDFLAFNTTPTATANAVGKMVWNNTEGTLEFRLRGNNVTLQVGQERVAYCRNADTTTINDGEAVYVFGASGARPSVKKSTNTSINAQRTIGIATETFAVGANGFVTSYGIVHDLNTSAFAEGDFLYVGVGGALINTVPTPPAYSVFVGVCIKVDAADGHIFVCPNVFQALSQSPDVLITTPANNDILQYDAASGLWKNKTNIFSSTTDGTVVTGTTAETITYTCAIPANSFAVGDDIQIRFRFRKAISTGSTTFLVYVNTSAVIGGATKVATLTTSSTRFQQFKRDMAIKSSTDTQVFSTTTSSATDDTTNAGFPASLNINWTITQYFVITITNAVSGDSANGSFYCIENH
jgi:hypothetical protein